MLATAVTAAFAFILYLLLTFSSGTVGVWSLEELLSGAVLAVIAGLIGGRLAKPREKGKKSPYRLLNPLRFLLFVIYLLGPFLFALARANLDVAYRVLTGRIRPGIVRISPGLATDFGRTLLANSITLTPGTLTVDVDDESGDFYVHWIQVSDPEAPIESVCGSFARWARRIAE
ncbi:MAG: Na+/H+ antiporter subunit E [Candidatus Bipolaricaulia bacterium]